MIQLEIVARPTEDWVNSACRDCSAVIKILGVKPLNHSLTEHLTEISSSSRSAENLRDSLQSFKNVKSTDLAKVGDNRLMGTVTSTDCRLCATLARFNCFFGPATSRIEDCRVEWKIFLNEYRDLKSLLQKLDDVKIDFNLLEVARLVVAKDLTARQERILRTAYELGYFDFPRRIKVSELAKRLDIKSSTFSEILRRAQRNFLRRYFEQSPA